MTLEQLAALSTLGAWRYVIHGPQGIECPYVPGSRSAHRFNAERADALGRKRDRWKDNVTDRDATVERISKRPMYD